MWNKQHRFHGHPANGEVYYKHHVDTGQGCEQAATRSIAVKPHSHTSWKFYNSMKIGLIFKGLSSSFFGFNL